MKILKLKFKNINSLVGENEIDFTTPFFTNDGLFAITGKTGAGKSSILDAITLALYGKTPRVEISGSENHVMTKGQKDCYSEVTFEVSGKKWIASWKQERTRTGSLKNVERAIIDDKNIIVADKLVVKRNQSNSEEKSVNEKIEEILGLNFSQFTKVILLAQGSFTAFLKADKNEKGQLLEQITGTEIYGEISKYVFERAKKENEKLEGIGLEIGAIQLYSESEVLALKSEITQLSANKSETDAEVIRFESAIKWLQTIEELENQLRITKERLPELDTNYQVAEVDTQQKINLFENAKNNFVTQEEKFKNVRTLDTKLEEKTKLLAPITDSLQKQEREKIQIQENIKSKEKTFNLSKEELQTKQTWAKNHAIYEELISTYPVISLKNEQFEQKKRNQATLNNELTELEEKLKQLQKTVDQENEAFTQINKEYIAKNQLLEALKNELLTCLAGKKFHVLQEEKETLLRSKELLQQVYDHIKLIDRTSEEQEEIRVLLIQFDDQIPFLERQIDEKQKDQQDIEKQISLLEENIQLAKTVLSLEEHRMHLKEGEACPLCGSEDHPYASNTPPILGDRESELEKLKEIKRQLIETERNLITELTRIQTSKNHQLTLLENTQNTLSNKNDSLNNLLTDLQEIAITIPTNQQRYEFIQQESEKIKNQIDQHALLISEAKRIDKSLAQVRDELLPDLSRAKTESEQKKQTAEFDLTSKQSDFQEKKNQLQFLDEQVAVESNEITQELQKYQVVSVSELKNCLDSWNTNKSLIENLKEEVSRLELILSQLRNQEIAIQNGIKEKVDDKNIITEEFDRLKEERNTHFGEQNVDEVENRLKSEIESAESIKNQAEAIKQNTFNDLTNAQAIIAEKQRELSEKQALKLSDIPLSNLTSTLNETKRQLDEIVEKIGAKNQLLSTNEQNSSRVSNILPRKIKQEEITTKWNLLNDQIGSGDGKKYRNFAQALTFEHLIALANKQLKKMSDRYTLKRTGDANNPFELSVIDSFQNNDERTAQNLCGGENFMVSLSLALGLANMAGKNMQIDSMFIDEGFATLDPDTLDVALNTLSNLQTEGKMIGVISHITELKERIATHIQVVQKGNGYSEIVM